MATQAEASHNPGLRSSGNLRYLSAEVRHALTAWTRAKETLANAMCREDFQAFVRPMYLCGLLSHRFLVLSLPPNRRVVERARNFRHNVERALAAQGYGLAGFTAYPSTEQLLAQWNNPSFGPFLQLISRKRIDKLMAQRAAEDRRDRETLR